MHPWEEPRMPKWNLKLPTRSRSYLQKTVPQLAVFVTNCYCFFCV